MYCKTVTMPEIARRLGVTLGVVEGWHKRDGWKAERDKIRQELKRKRSLALKAEMEESALEFQKDMSDVANQGAKHIKKKLKKKNVPIDDLKDIMSTAKSTVEVGRAMYGVGEETKGKRFINVALLCGKIPGQQPRVLSKNEVDVSPSPVVVSESLPVLTDGE